MHVPQHIIVNWGMLCYYHPIRNYSSNNYYVLWYTLHYMLRDHSTWMALQRTTECLVFKCALWQCAHFVVQYCNAMVWTGPWFTQQTPFAPVLSHPAHHLKVKLAFSIATVHKVARLLGVAYSYPDIMLQTVSGTFLFLGLWTSVAIKIFMSAVWQ